MYGIDFGAKLSGTTVVAFLNEKSQTVQFQASLKNENADEFLLDFFASKKPSLIMLDAPLSLPAAYTSASVSLETDYFFRQCDRETGAMSPMFLGGLTARAICIAQKLRSSKHTVIETYPRALARAVGLEMAGYKQGKEYIKHCVELLSNTQHISLHINELATWHHFDALLALYSGMRMRMGKAIRLGHDSEGIIVY